MKFTDILEKYGISYKLAGESEHVSGDWVGVDCPFCQDHEEYHLGYHPSGRLSCWQCGYHNVVEALIALTGEPPWKIRELTGSLETYRNEPKKRGKLVLPKGIVPLNTLHKNYLKSRGFDPKELASTWGVQGIGLAERFQWRIFIPIHNSQGEMVSWTTRVPTDDPDHRYTGARPSEESIRAKNLLYGEHHARHTIVIVEGPTDAWKVGPGAVAVLGTGFTKAQILRASKYLERIVCFDAETEAQRKAARLCEALGPFPGVVVNVVLDSKDPGSATKREIQTLRRLLI